MWAEEELKTGTLSNGTVENYLGAIRCINKHPIAARKLKTVTAEHLQAFLDLLTRCFQVMGDQFFFIHLIIFFLINLIS